MLMDNIALVLNRFPNVTPPYVDKAEGAYLFLEGGKKLFDATAGYSACVSVGYSHPEVISAIEKQLKKYSYLCSHAWNTHLAGDLAEILLKDAPAGLDQVYYSGTSGSDSLEAALKMSYQIRYNTGKKEKSWYICRDNSYHGVTLQALSITNIDVWSLYEPLLPKNVGVIAQHNPYTSKNAGESDDAYARRCANELEAKILEIGPENVCAFVGETMLGQLAGNVPPAPGYWKYIREVCDRHDVHLILDEVYCGLGRAGKQYCCNWDGISADFIAVGKMLAGGYVPLSAVITKREYREVIAKGQGRVMYGHTHQAHPLGLAAALAVQKIMNRPEMLSHINDMGALMREKLVAALGTHPFFGNIRGRGMLISLEYNCPNRHQFGSTIEQRMLDDHDIIINSRWHRSSFTPPCTIDKSEVSHLIDCYVETFKAVAASWPE